jgi:hypothetical protein
MWHDFGEVLLMSLEVLAGMLLLWFLWSIGSDLRKVLCWTKWLGE